MLVYTSIYKNLYSGIDLIRIIGGLEYSSNYYEFLIYMSFRITWVFELHEFMNYMSFWNTKVFNKYIFVAKVYISQLSRRNHNLGHVFKMLKQKQFLFASFSWQSKREKTALTKYSNLSSKVQLNCVLTWFRVVYNNMECLLFQLKMFSMNMKINLSLLRPLQFSFHRAEQFVTSETRHLIIS